MFSQKPLKLKNLTKHKVLKHFIENADDNCVYRYYNDPYFQNVPNVILLDYIQELSDDGYLKPRVRHVILTTKSYSYLADYRNAKIKSFLLHLSCPISHFLSWIFGVASGVLIEYLIRRLL